MLLKKMRSFIQLMQNEGNEVDFQDLCRTLRDAMDEGVSVYLVSKKGKILAHSLEEGFETTPFDEEWLLTGAVSHELNSSLLKMGAIGTIEAPNGEVVIVAPVVGAGRRVGSIIFVRNEGSFDEEHTIIIEFASTTIGIVMVHAIDGEEEGEAQESKLARSAIKSLSYSEILAMQHIFDELEEDEGLLVASRIADNAGITRSVIVNALRKLASANVVESRSLGMKGTYLRILNREIRSEFEKQRYPYPKGNLERRKA